MKKTSSTSYYNLRSRLREISGSTQKKHATSQPSFVADPDCRQCQEELAQSNQENTDSCELCFPEEAEFSGNIATSSRPESPSILQAVSAITPDHNPSASLQAEKASLSRSSTTSDTADSESEDFTETTPLISLPKNPKNLLHENNSKEGKESHCTETKGSHYYLEHMPTSGYDFASETMDAVSLTDLQRNIMDLQRQVGRCTDVAQELDRNYTTTGLPDTIKLPLFHGYESENFERWLEKFLLHLGRRRLRPTSDAALAELALHLAGPAESFFRSLSRRDKETVDSLSTALRERFSSKDRVWRMRQMLSARKQGSSEPLDKYIEDLQNKFDNLDLSEEEKVWFFTQGLRPDTQKEVLMRQPRTFREAENAARLMQTVQQSIQDTKGNDALSRIQQQLDALVSGMATKEKPKEASVSAYQFSPQTSNDDDRLARLERDLKDIKQAMTLVSGHHIQDSAITYM